MKDIDISTGFFSYCLKQTCDHGLRVLLSHAMRAKELCNIKHKNSIILMTAFLSVVKIDKCLNLISM